jgi:PadR family transcriptional regulator, regulatory protein PadR
MIVEKAQKEAYENLSQELRRGILVLGVMSQLKLAKHGYALMSELTEQGLTIDQGTLYPLLRRLESQGLLESTWNTEGARPRRYYVLNEAGTAVLTELEKDWRGLARVVVGLFNHGE